MDNVNIAYSFKYYYIVPDELVMELVKERLSKPDCAINGWILDGCPSTEEQISKLKELGFSPQLVVELDLSDSLVYEKLEQKRFDPIDGHFYNIIKDRLPDRTIMQRLI